MSGYYNREGEPLDLRLWAKMIEDADYQRVALDTVGDVEVSTVWLGLDHQYGDGPPLIFETMVFGGQYENACWRYPTIHAARAGHDQVVAAVRAGMNLETLKL